VARAAASLVRAESLQEVLAGSRRRREDSGANGSSADMFARSRGGERLEGNVASRRSVVARVRVCGGARATRATRPHLEAFSRTERANELATETNLKNPLRGGLFQPSKGAADLKGAKVSRACAERARSRNALGLKSARARNAYGSSPRFGFNSREQHADEDTTGAIRLAGSGFGPRERALCGNLNFFPRLVAECQIFENRETNIPYENFRRISLFEAFARPALLHYRF
jgi:hypothetical protein